MMIYLDNAATTRMDQDVITAMLPYFSEHFGNPSGLYDIAAVSRRAVNKAREQIGYLLNCDKNEIYFTAGGTESDNWVIQSMAGAGWQAKRHVITSKIEHPAVLNTCRNIEKAGMEVSYIGVDENGIIRLDELENAIRDNTVLITVMTANNEIGTIQPIKEIGRIAKKHHILFHTDAVQAFGQIPIDVKEMQIDMLSASGHKLYGPKGTGFLYIRKGIELQPFMHGGTQEHMKRAGTENVAGIVGLGRAAELCQSSMMQNMEKEAALRDYCMDRLMKEVPYARINGERKKRLPNNINVSFQFVEGQQLVVMLDMKGICSSTGSACSSGQTDPSHVLLAIGLPIEIARGSLRLTLGKDTTKSEIDTVIEAVKESTAKLRSNSPVYEDYMLRQGQCCKCKQI